MAMDPPSQRFLGMLGGGLWKVLKFVFMFGRARRGAGYRRRAGTRSRNSGTRANGGTWPKKSGTPWNGGSMAPRAGCTNSSVHGHESAGCCMGWNEKRCGYGPRRFCGATRACTERQRVGAQDGGLNGDGKCCDDGACSSGAERTEVRRASGIANDAARQELVPLAAKAAPQAATQTTFHNTFNITPAPGLDERALARCEFRDGQARPTTGLPPIQQPERYRIERAAPS